MKNTLKRLSRKWPRSTRDPNNAPPPDNPGLHHEHNSPQHNLMNSKTPLPGDRPKDRAPGEMVTKEELRDLRELMRKRYALDLEIWHLRYAKAWDYHIVEEKMRKADATLKKIRDIVDSFDSRDYFDSDRDYAKLQEIRRRMAASGKRENWMLNPPWKDAEVTNEFESMHI